MKRNTTMGKLLQMKTVQNIIWHRDHRLNKNKTKRLFEIIINAIDEKISNNYSIKSNKRNTFVCKIYKRILENGK